jgi:hypothetical protein
MYVDCEPPPKWSCQCGVWHHPGRVDRGRADRDRHLPRRFDLAVPAHCQPDGRRVDQRSRRSSDRR